VLLNGGKAEHSFRRIVLPTLPANELTCVRLPSTSPAHAALRAEQKRQAWREALRAAASRPPAERALLQRAYFSLISRRRSSR
jgi:G:T/U-mismatch repair DNA glycosylase